MPPPDTIAPGLRLLSNQQISRGQRWVFSAGFNITSAGRDRSRIDSELADITYLGDRGARVAVLSHQGRHHDGTARHLDDAATYLATRLGRPVPYIPDNITSQAAAAAQSLRPGEVAVFGNTRHHAGEEAGDTALAARFAQLGERTAIGGFSKAHRAHASNVGLLDHLPGYAAHSLIEQIQRLTPWAGRQPATPSVAVIGGVKPEKILAGLRGLAHTYDIVIPGGVVLNHVLRQQGACVGDSILGDDPIRCAAATAEVMASATARIHIPRRVIIARRTGTGYADRRDIDISDGVPSGFWIVDFTLEPGLERHLHHLSGQRRCRAVIAGTPTLYTSGFRHGTNTILRWTQQQQVDTILLGGDTTAELPSTGHASTGGGSALHYLADGDLPVLRALRLNAKRWPA